MDTTAPWAVVTDIPEWLWSALGVIVPALAGLVGAYLAIHWQARRGWTQDHTKAIADIALKRRADLGAVQATLQSNFTHLSESGLKALRSRFQEDQFSTENTMFSQHLVGRGIDENEHYECLKDAISLIQVHQETILQLRELVRDQGEMFFSNHYRNYADVAASSLVRVTFLSNRTLGAILREQGHSGTVLLWGVEVMTGPIAKAREIHVQLNALLANVHARLTNTTGQWIQPEGASMSLLESVRRSRQVLDRDIQGLEAWQLTGLEKDSCAICLPRRKKVRRAMYRLIGFPVPWESGRFKKRRRQAFLRNRPNRLAGFLRRHVWRPTDTTGASTDPGIKGHP